MVIPENHLWRGIVCRGTKWYVISQHGMVWYGHPSFTWKSSLTSPPSDTLSLLEMSEFYDTHSKTFIRRHFLGSWIFKTIRELNVNVQMNGIQKGKGLKKKNISLKQMLVYIEHAILKQNVVFPRHLWWPKWEEQSHQIHIYHLFEHLNTPSSSHLPSLAEGLVGNKTRIAGSPFLFYSIFKRSQ